MNSKRHGNEETWSRGANSRLPFAVNGLSFTKTLWNDGSLGGLGFGRSRFTQCFKLQLSQTGKS